VEGLNVGGILLGYVAVLLCGVTSLAALVLLITRKFRGARILFATGVASANFIFSMAALTFLQPQYRQDASVAMIVLIGLSLLLAGSGQLIAAFRNGATYAAAFACTATAMLILIAFSMFGADMVGGFGQSLLGYDVPITAASLLFAMASLVIALYSPWKQAA
jgi:hypothetical protein